MPRPYDALVLMGPPGSGKSFLGNMLHARGIAHFEDLEPQLIARFGTGEEFAKNKAAALEFIHDRYVAQLSEQAVPVVIQSTGLSDAAIIRALAQDHRILYCRINTPKAVCIERVGSRAAGRNLNNDPEFTAQFHDHWIKELAPQWQFDIELDGLEAEASVAVIDKQLRPCDEYPS